MPTVIVAETVLYCDTFFSAPYSNCMPKVPPLNTQVFFKIARWQKFSNKPKAKADFSVHQFVCVGDETKGVRYAKLKH